jgi:hypothetical protein
MVSGLCEEDSAIGNLVDETMLLSDSSRPDSATQITERLGLSYARDGISPYGFDELKYLSSGLVVGGDPVGEIF